MAMTLRERLEAAGSVIRDGGNAIRESGRADNRNLQAAVDAAQQEAMLIAVEALVGIDESLRAMTPIVESGLDAVAKR